MRNLTCASEKGKVGICTTQQSKHSSVKMAEMFFIRSAISIHTNFVSTTKALKKLKMQLESFKRIRHDSKTGRSSVSLSGKDGSSQDDLVMSFLIALFYSDRLLTGRLGVI